MNSSDTSNSTFSDILQETRAEGDRLAQLRALMHHSQMQVAQRRGDLALVRAGYRACSHDQRQSQARLLAHKEAELAAAIAQRVSCERAVAAAACQQEGAVPSPGRSLQPTVPHAGALPTLQLDVKLWHAREQERARDLAHYQQATQAAALGENKQVTVRLAQLRLALQAAQVRRAQAERRLASAQAHARQQGGPLIR